MPTRKGVVYGTVSKHQSEKEREKENTESENKFN